MRRAICSRRDTCATSALLHKKICIQCTILSLSQKKLCTFIFFHTTSPAIVAQYTDILHRPDLLFTRLSRSDVPQCQTLPWRISTLELGYCFSQTSHTWVRVLEEKSYLCVSPYLSFSLLSDLEILKHCSFSIIFMKKRLYMFFVWLTVHLIVLIQTRIHMISSHVVMSD